MAETKDVIVEVPPHEEAISHGDEETEAMLKKADEIVDNALNEVIEKIENKVEDAVDEIKNEEVKVAAQIAMTAVNQVIENKEEIIDKATDKVFEGLVEKAKEVGVKKSTLALIIKFVMEAVEDTPVKGAEQKDYALRLIRALVMELAEGDDKEYLLIALDSGSVADTIDLIVAATRGELNVNMVVETATTSCLPCLMSIMSKKSKKEKTNK